MPGVTRCAIYTSFWGSLEYTLTRNVIYFSSIFITILSNSKTIFVAGVSWMNEHGALVESYWWRQNWLTREKTCLIAIPRQMWAKENIDSSTSTGYYYYYYYYYYYWLNHTTQHLSSGKPSYFPDSVGFSSVRWNSPSPLRSKGVS
jgi:hypothetical protein